MLKLGKTKGLSILKDPFKIDKIKWISLDYSKVMFEKIWSWKASIKFSNGNTEGVQKFEVRDDQADNSFEQITKEIQAFIDSL